MDPRLASLGFTQDADTADAAQAYREQRLRDLGVDDADRDEAAPWVPVRSSNVAAVRWVGGRFGLQVRFLNGGVYEYDAGEDAYDDLFAAGSKGRWVAKHLKDRGVPYRKL